MNIKQTLLITAIQIAFTFSIFSSQMPDFIQQLVHGTEYNDNGVTMAYGIIFKYGIITMLIFGTIFVGTKTKNELKFILFSEFFLAIIFYQQYTENYLVLTLIFLTLSLVIFLLRIPFRKLITQKEILA